MMPVLRDNAGLINFGGFNLGLSIYIYSGGLSHYLEDWLKKKYRPWDNLIMYNPFFSSLTNTKEIKNIYIMSHLA